MHGRQRTPAQLPIADGSNGDTPAIGDGRPGHAHSMWWMVVCCAPMVLIALAILFGALGPR